MTGPTLRERQRAAAYEEITHVALELFLSQGFEATTIDQIVAAAGISRRSFFRYFGTKEDIVLGDLIQRGKVVAEAVAERPSHEDPWEALRAGLLAANDVIKASEDIDDLALGHMLFETPPLYARHLEKRLRWQQMLVPLIAERLAGPQESVTLRASAIVATSLACLDQASRSWVASNGASDLSSLYDEAINAVRS